MIVVLPAARDLRDELDAIASCELADVLAAWPNVDDAHARQLAAYVRDELAEGGMLSVGKGRECGQPMARIRRDARRVLDVIERSLPTPAASPDVDASPTSR